MKTIFDSIKITYFNDRENHVSVIIWAFCTLNNFYIYQKHFPFFHT